MRGKGFTLVSRSERAFTLIELLVTIAILATLMAIAIMTFANVQKKSRDAKRQSDLKVIQGVLEQYHADQGFYPKNSNSGVAQSFSSLTVMTGNRFNNRTGLNSLTPTPSIEKVYLKTIPRDPQDNSLTIIYQYLALSSTGAYCDNLASDTYCTKYSLCANLDNPPTGSTCSQNGSFNYEVTSP